MKTGQRGILLGGWAEMSAAVLEGEEDSEKLLAYCKDGNAEVFLSKKWIDCRSGLNPTEPAKLFGFSPLEAT